MFDNTSRRPGEAAGTASTTEATEATSTAALAVSGWWGPAIHEQRRAPRWLWAVPALMVLPGLGSLLGGLGPADRSASYLLALVIFGGFHAVNLAFGQPVGSTVQQVVIAFLIGSVFYEDRQALHDAVHLTLDRGQVLRWVS